MTQPKQKILQWYKDNKRILPWRESNNPYYIWISEVMLQQTTVSTVIPYYKAFIKKFKTLKNLAQSPLEEVMPYWSGLGYYNRIKNLHLAAQIINQQKFFPRKYRELLKLPGFGPYTARAVSSLAFNEKVGALDTNIIRVLSRYNALKIHWWKTKEREKLQTLADGWMKNVNPATMNQALMELGALVCTSKEPQCSACPLNKTCLAYKTKTFHLIPIKKTKKKKEIWLWEPIVYTRQKKIAFIKNMNILPFLKTHLVFPGQSLQKKQTPRTYHFIHFITHHTIYVRVHFINITKPQNIKLIWLTLPEIKKKSPSSLIQKVLHTTNDI